MAAIEIRLRAIKGLDRMLACAQLQGSEHIDVGRPPGGAQADSACGATVASDSACTVGIIGSGGIPYVHRVVWTAPVVTARTVSGAVSSS